MELYVVMFVVEQTEHLNIFYYVNAFSGYLSNNNNINVFYIPLSPTRLNRIAAATLRLKYYIG